jgi:hypothetical protein
LRHAKGAFYIEHASRPKVTAHGYTPATQKETDFLAKPGFSWPPVPDISYYFNSLIIWFLAYNTHDQHAHSRHPAADTTF